MQRLRPSGATGLLLVLLSGCKGCESETTLPHLLDAEDATPVGVWVAEGLGDSPLHVPVFATNALGAAVPAGDLALTSDATVPGAATPGADGWAEAEVTGAPGRYTLDASAGGVSGAGGAWLTAAPTGRIDAPGTPLPSAPTAIAAAGAGVASAIAGEVWWSSFDGRQPARVLALPDDVLHVASVEIDADGVTDLLVTSARHVVALRGRDGGGLTWGAGWTAAESYTVIGASAGHFDADNLVDLGVAVDVGGTASLLVLGGDGAWAFDPVDALAPDYAAFAISLDDLDGDGVGEATFLSDAGLLRRYTKLDGEWTATLTGTQYDLDLGAGSRLLPTTDVTGDGVADILAVGPSLVDGTGTHAWVVTAGSEQPARYEFADDLAPYAWMGLAVGDLSGDGTADLAYAAPGKLARAVWSDADGNFQVRSWGDAPVTSALAILDGDGDGVADVVSAGAGGLRLFAGGRTADDPVTADVDETEAWRPATPDVGLFGLDLLLPPVVADATGDGVADLAGVVRATEDAGLAVEGVLGVAATDTTPETLRSGGTVTVSGSGTAIAFAACDRRAFLLYEEADELGNLGTWLARVNFAAGMGPTLDGAPVAVTGDVLVCGEFADGEVAVSDATGAVSYVDASGAVTAGESVGAVGDAAAADLDGDGVDELVTCAEDGCRVAVADLDGDGTLETVVQSSTGIAVSFAGVETLLAAEGAVSVGDCDGDGVSELVVGLDGMVQVFHGVAGALSPAVASWTWRPAHDAVQLADLDGDGLNDVFLLGEDRYPDDAAGDTWDGTLIYARAE